MNRTDGGDVPRSQIDSEPSLEEHANIYLSLFANFIEVTLK